MAKNKQIDLSKLQNGLYYLNINNQIVKVIKQNWLDKYLLFKIVYTLSDFNSINN